MKKWFTSDTHFNHKRTLELSRRPFRNVEEMNEVLIENWNHVVGKDDVVFHLGDFGDYEFSKYLNGEIILLFGNYERKDISKGVITEEELVSKYNFRKVYTEKIVQYDVDGEVFYLVHEPVHAEAVKDELNSFYLYGHVHKLQMVKKNGLNVGVDCHNFTPISLDDVKMYRNEKNW